MSSAPIIFIHYGVSGYLEHTMRAAVRFNPQRDVVLIGDKSNAHLADLGVRHVLFDDFAKGDSVDEFNNQYERIGGVVFEQINAMKGGQDWTRFNFLKWIVLDNYVKANHLKSFWTFDSDTLLISDLHYLEDNFGVYDYTVINSMDVMQGYVANPEYLGKYVQLLNAMLADKEALEHLRRTEFTENPSWGFTMMRVFRELAKSQSPRIFQLKTVEHNLYFDQCICQTENEDTYPKELYGQTLKKVFSDGKGGLYNYNTKLGTHVRLWGINMSWVPDYLFPRFLAELEGNAGTEGMKLVNVEPPLSFRVKRFTDKVKHKLNLSTSK